jgi:hypothetical protein
MRSRDKFVAVVFFGWFIIVIILIIWPLLRIDGSWWQLGGRVGIVARCQGHHHPIVGLNSLFLSLAPFFLVESGHGKGDVLRLRECLRRRRDGRSWLWIESIGKSPADLLGLRSARRLGIGKRRTRH